MAQSSYFFQIQRLLKLVAERPDGARLKDFLGDPDLGLDRRAIQRRLQDLVRGGQLRKDGVTNGTRYWSAVPAIPSTPVQAEDYPPLSPSARGQRDHIRRPLSQRRPVPYRRAFLDEYQPGSSFYLSTKLRAHLMAMGRPNTTEKAAGTYARLILERLLIDLAFNSSRLEGNTYSLLDTKQLLMGAGAPPGKDLRETQMILNHKGAIEYLVEQAEQIDFNPFTIRNLHALLSENLMGDPADCGRVRTRAVHISGTVYRPPEVPSLIEECFLQLLLVAQAIEDPMEQAFFILVQLPYLQPFMDVNKRTSRLAANIPFIRKNLCPLSFSGVPGDAYTEGMLAVYELNQVDLLRDVFVWAYERSCAEYQVVRQTLGEPDPFRLKYRDLTRSTVQEVVQQTAGPDLAMEVIERAARSSIPAGDRARFLAMIETELNGLHEGNIVRYKLSLEEWERWRSRWSRDPD